MPFARTAIHADREPASAAQPAFRRWSFALLAASTLLCANAALAAGGSNSPDAATRYQTERAACFNGQSNQDRATCLREAGAARGESRRGNLNDGRASYQQNALTRCKALPPDDRQACERRIQGEGAATGSVGGGGIYREIATPVAPQDGAAPDGKANDAR